MTEQTAHGSAVRSAREARGLSLRRVALQLEVSPATLSGIELGRTPLSLERLHRLAELLDVPAARLLAGEPTTAQVPALPGDQDRDWRDFSRIEMGPVLEAATRVFVRKGYHAAGMREVAAESGLSVAGVYHHYASKQQLLSAVLDVTMSEISWRIEAARVEGGSEVESFARMVEALALFHAVRGDLAFVGASEMRSFEGAELKRIARLRNEVQYALDDQAARCQSAGAFDCPDIHTAARAVATMCTALPSWFRLDGRLSAEEVARRYAGYALSLMNAR
ncbi:TetR family transcriptional regulator [Nocardioides dokdonensis]|uniref:TetR family transcriptional regulator n=1 Tax=Nocardioides dokdonensis TaxID=450734 RepID=UPI00083603B9|nr:TetR family transcriptional regulator [Nocardioides dokdonensis]